MEQEMGQQRGQQRDKRTKASAYVLFEFPYNANKILRKRRLVAQSVTLARRAKVPDEIDDLDDVVHHLFPHLAIKIDFLKKNSTESSLRGGGKKTTTT